mgnify:CR=1 FL=1|tara:strand:+ start:59920 stop:60924 length:1005 start_codon:yes stop_codon:yes gene_type:complete
MKINYHYKSNYILLFSIFFIVFTSSCTIYQNVPDDDGIYSSERRVIVTNSQEYIDYENNYFTKELERIDNINGTDILTDVETYSSVNDTIQNSLNSINNYNPNSAWGNEDNDNVVININLNNNDYGWGTDWNLYNPFYSNYGYFNSWYGRSWRLGWRNRWNNYFWGGYGFFNNPYNNFGPYNPYNYGMNGYGFSNWDYYYGSGFAYNGFRNQYYGRRVANNNISNRRNQSSTSRRLNSFVNNANRESTKRVKTSSSNYSRKKVTGANNSSRVSNTATTRSNNRSNNKTSSRSQPTRRSTPSRSVSPSRRSSPSRSSSPSRRSSPSRSTSPRRGG